ncbi:universal stress protein [Devosia sp. YIM 151766]|uniref:universal stress protein n=1 Tax=Devosia sp. YIM 151766 TaxID=3017325 RepID=UPI00255CC266|nr:universal stress protein [Devosia sp. YIM 151766]WIY52023.1 universal stress protein [Devosia sp. YIM 151766]
MSIKIILVAMALEDDSTQVADRAIALANEHKAQLVGVHIVETLPPRDPDLPLSIDTDALSAMIREERAGQLQALLQKADRPAIVHIDAGKPHAIIETLARSHHADLIVIGPGIARNLREKVFGSTADRVVRCAPCPVLIVRKHALGPYGHVAIGVDFSDHAKAAAHCAARVSPSASREFIHTIEIPLAFEQAMLKAGTPQAEIDRYRRAKAKAARQQVMDTFGENGRLPEAARVRIVQGNPAIVLLNASRRRGTDLVALGTQGANAVTQHLLGSVARKVLAGSGCDVLVVPDSAV